MEQREAAALFARVVSHWPSLGGNAKDPLAMARSSDWVAMLTRHDREVGTRATEHLIAEWTERFPPRPGHWLDRMRAARREAETHAAIGAGPPKPALPPPEVRAGRISDLQEMRAVAALVTRLEDAEARARARQKERDRACGLLTQWVAYAAGDLVVAEGLVDRTVRLLGETGKVET